jgi:hypothetical protein
MPSLARADTGGAGELVLVFVVIYGCVYYVILCLFSIPLSLLLLGSRLKRIGIGLVVPLIGIGLGALIAYWLELKHYLYYANVDQETVFLVISNIPMVLLLIWVLVSSTGGGIRKISGAVRGIPRAEKSLAKLADAIRGAQMTPNNAFERIRRIVGAQLAMDYVLDRAHQRRRPAVQRNR